MKVALDVSPEFMGQTGVARYSRELRTSLVEANVDVAAFGIARGVVARDGIAVSRIPRRALSLPGALIIAGLGLRSSLQDCDLIHDTDISSLRPKLPKVTTVHDLAALEFPELHPPHATQQQRDQLRSVARSDAICADSLATADALVRHGIPAQRISVCPLGTRPLTSPPNQGERLPNLLFVSEIHPRKGVDVLLKAWALQPRRDWTLTIVGPRGFQADQILHGAHELAGVRIAGRVDESELERLYRTSAALVAPSVEEGFGLPLLEALSRLLPVICSDIPVFREVAGDLAIFVDRDDTQAWSKAMHSIGRRPPPDWQNAAAHRAAAFTWARTAAATINVYESVVR